MGKQLGTVISYGVTGGSIQGLPVLFFADFATADLQISCSGLQPSELLFILTNMGADFTGVTMSGIKTPVLQWLRSCFSGKGFPWFVLICMLTVTTGLWQYTEITLINQSLDRFHSRVDKQKKQYR